MEECILYYENDTQDLFIEGHDGQLFLAANGITGIQAINLARVFTRKYDSVKIFDGEEEAYIKVKNKIDPPIVNTMFDEARDDVEKTYGLYVEKEYEDQTDLDKEKWDNYWGDYNQCGVHVSWN